MNRMSKHIIARSRTPKGDGSLGRYGRHKGRNVLIYAEILFARLKVPAVT